MLLFFEDVVVLPRVFGGLLILILLLVVKVIAEVIVYKQAIVFLLLLVVADGCGVEDDIRLLLDGFQDDLLVLIVVFEGRLDRPIEEICWLCWL